MQAIAIGSLAPEISTGSMSDGGAETVLELGRLDSKATKAGLDGLDDYDSDVSSQSSAAAPLPAGRHRGSGTRHPPRRLTLRPGGGVPPSGVDRVGGAGGTRPRGRVLMGRDGGGPE